MNETRFKVTTIAEGGSCWICEVKIKVRIGNVWKNIPFRAIGDCSESAQRAAMQQVKVFMFEARQSDQELERHLRHEWSVRDAGYRSLGTSAMEGMKATEGA